MVADIPVYSPLLINLAEVGLAKYHEYITLCTIGVNALEELPDEEVMNFDVLLSFVLQQGGVYERFIESLKFFTRLDFEITQDEDRDFLFASGDIHINRENYDEFVRVIKLVACIKDDVPTEELDEFDKMVLEAEKTISDAQGGEGENIPLKDLISSVCNMDENGLSILNIWDINIFSFYEQMKRGQLREGYFLGIKQLLAGADSKDVELEYYIQKTD